MARFYRHGWLSTIILLQICCAVRATVFAIPGTGYLPATVRAACRAILATQITQCSSTLMLEASEIFPEDLDAICTSGCLTALNSMRSTALTRCGTTSVDIPLDSLEPPTYISVIPLHFADELIYRYKMANQCVRAPDDSYCKVQMANMTQDMLCRDCHLKKTQLQLNWPFEHAIIDKPQFSSLLSSCGVPAASYSVTYTVTATVAPTGSPLPSCTSTYVAKETDTANSVAAALQVSTDRLLTYNSIPLNMNGTFTSGEILCLDHVTKCLTRVVQPNDTCASYLALIGNNVSEHMLRSWNPTFGHECGNLKTMVGKLICIGPPGPTPTSYSEKTPAATESPITSSTTDSLTWSRPAEITSTSTTANTATRHMYWPPTMPIISTMIATPAPASSVEAYLARISHCAFNNYGDGSWEDGLADNEYKPGLYDLDESCHDIWEPYCHPDIAKPVLPSPTAIPSSCYPNVVTITPTYVPPPAATQSGSPANCIKWHVAVSGDTCDLISSAYAITFADFQTWNPSINAACTNILAKYAYCVRIHVPQASSTTAISSATKSATLAPPGPTGTGTSAACYRWHVKQTGDTCESIASTYGIVVSRFRQLNRGVSTACNNLVGGNAYCVAA